MKSMTRSAWPFWTAAVSLCAICATSSFAIGHGRPGLANFGAVAPGLYRGAAPTLQGIANLKKMGVMTVIDLRISPKRVRQEGREVKAAGMTFVNLAMGADPPTPQQERTFLALAGAAAKHPMYVHCQYGADRTGVMVGLYRRIDDHWSWPKTYAEMRYYGFKPWQTKLKKFVKAAPIPTAR